MITVFKSELEKVGSEELGACLVAVMSHGSDYDWFITDDELQMDLYGDVIDQFNTRNCSILQNIPKVFLVNICRLIYHTIETFPSASST
jgi:hypothetical protein